MISIQIPTGHILPQEILKRCIILGDLHSEKKIVSDFRQEFLILKAKYVITDYSNTLINSIINSFHQDKEDFLIPTTFSEQRKEAKFQVIFCK